LACALALLLASQERPWSRVAPGTALEFPRDHGAHFDFRTEWWYVTANLEDEGGRRFGAQLTFFRSGLGPSRPPDEAAPLRAHHAWAGHLALVDVEGQRTLLAERLRRDGSSLVQASTAGLELFLEDWSMTQGADGRIALAAADPTAGIGIELELSPAKPLVLHGAGGVSSKGSEPGNASIYASWTRLAAAGRVVLGGEARAVRGAAWLDHEWGTSQLGAGVVGWDWFGLQLDDGRELMLYGLRRADGTVDPLSGGTLVERDGTARALVGTDFEVAVQATWESPRSSARYPARWTIAVPRAGLALEARPLSADCELDTRSTDVIYWEGPVELRERATGRPAGRGYAELVGYAHPMTGRF
jgi:predicted secreted hydrolase